MPTPEPRAGGQAGAHMENASSVGPRPAGFVPLLCLAWHSLHPGDAQQRALTSLWRGLLMFAALGHCLCTRRCAGHVLFPSFHSHRIPILQVRIQAQRG